jgi:autotransporter-associated beta strand protein
LTVANLIGGTGIVRNTGAGSITPTRPNTYSGGTQVNAGTLVYATDPLTGPVAGPPTFTAFGNFPNGTIQNSAVGTGVVTLAPGGTLTTDNGTQFTSSWFLETLGRLGITHRRTAYHHPEGNSYIERFHRSLKEEEV